MKSQRVIPMKDRQPIYRSWENGCMVYHVEGWVQVSRSWAEDHVCRGYARYVDMPENSQ